MREQSSRRIRQQRMEKYPRIERYAVGKIEIEDSVFALENWDRDIMMVMCCTVQFTFSETFDTDYKKFSGILKKQQRSLRQIMEQLILIETRIGRAYHYYTDKLQHLLPEEGKALLRIIIQRFTRKRKRADNEMMECVNEEYDLDEEDENVEGADAGDIEMVERKD